MGFLISLYGKKVKYKTYQECVMKISQFQAGKFQFCLIKRILIGNLSNFLIDSFSVSIYNRTSSQSSFF
jgi:hypothetical protein